MKIFLKHSEKKVRERVRLFYGDFLMEIVELLGQASSHDKRENIFSILVWNRQYQFGFHFASEFG